MIGRIEEQKLLLSLLEEDEPQFVAVFGRRRIGKTYLVRETFQHKFTFQHTGVSNADLTPGTRKKTQLEKFEESLREAGYRPPQGLKSWNDAFNGLKEVIRHSSARKKVIFIDELSWMDTKGSGLISALESFWNGWVTARAEKDIVLIVCASATYWMMDHIVNAKGGLHNRLTAQIHLKPFTLRECKEYMQSRNIVFSQHQLLQCYMILGGVPFYWSLLKRGQSLPQNIDYLFFHENAPLRNEFSNLYRALFNKPDQYILIIETLSKVKKGITREDICAATKISSSGDLSKKLTELENCGFIRRYTPFENKKKDDLYLLMDHFTLFYYHFLQGKAHDENEWENLVNSPSVNSWSGLAFERICLEHIPQIKKALGISGVHTEVYSWRCSPDSERGIYGSQIDLLISRKDQIINLCEMKYSTAEYMINTEFMRSMNRKISDFQLCTGTRYAIHPTLITVYGLFNNAYAADIQAAITACDLFE